METASLKDLPKLQGTKLYPAKNPHADWLRKLSRAILSRAIRDVTADDETRMRGGRYWREDALRWFLCEEDHPGSLAWVCHFLNLQPCRLRAWAVNYQVKSPAERQALARKLKRRLRA